MGPRTRTQNEFPLPSSEFLVLSWARASYRFLPPFFAPPFLAPFFATLYPPLRVGLVARSSHCVAAPRPSARRPALTALPALLLYERRCIAPLSRLRETSIEKKGVSSLDTPGPARRLSASSRPFSRRPSFRPFSPLFLLGMWQLSFVTGTRGSPQVG